MGSLEMTRLDLECSVGRGSSAVNNDESICVSKTTEGSCSSQSYSAADSSNQGQNSDSEIDQVSHSTRVSSVVATDCVVDIDQDGVDEVRISVERMERECRICMLSLDSGSGSAIELGCSCKNDLAAVHQHCAETWFRSKGNKICEICKSIAQNVVVPNNTKSRQQIIQEFEVVTFSRNADLERASEVYDVTRPVSSTSECGLVLVVCGFLLLFFFVTTALSFFICTYVIPGNS